MGLKQDVLQNLEQRFNYALNDVQSALNASSDKITYEDKVNTISNSMVRLFQISNAKAFADQFLVETSTEPSPNESSVDQDTGTEEEVYSDGNNVEDEGVDGL